MCINVLKKKHEISLNVNLRTLPAHYRPITSNLHEQLMDETWFSVRTALSLHLAAWPYSRQQSVNYIQEKQMQSKALAGSTPVIRWLFFNFFENDELDLWTEYIYIYNQFYLPIKSLRHKFGVLNLITNLITMFVSMHTNVIQMKNKFMPTPKAFIWGRCASFSLSK